MTETLTPARVSFRMDKHGPRPEVTAVFSGVQGTRNVLGLECYAHHGQHGACSPGWMWQKTRPATPEEYGPLLAELGRIGYAVTVVSRVTWTAP